MNVFNKLGGLKTSEGNLIEWVMANADGGRLLDLTVTFDLAVAHTFFCKREEYKITYKSGVNKTQIDLMMYRRSKFIEIKNCKVVSVIGRDYIHYHCIGR